ncbi:MAG: hypothetical protein A3G93_08445 [Nitrospinae bacterium RIFCSPLOWO2_12_FULL_45_22]|nr:MAG: hypothetical protein A3G93_08445 [Nitrospinae bacterium RIFCSPLOWO2_12_FULL_45_22]
MILYVAISPKGVHYVEVEALMEEEEVAKDFYRLVKPLLRDLGKAICQLNNRRGEEDANNGKGRKISG